MNFDLADAPRLLRDTVREFGRFVDGLGACANAPLAAQAAPVFRM
jgi:hypothetical protein